MLGIVWAALPCALMLALAYGKASTGAALDNPVLRTDGRVALMDAYLSAAVLIGLSLNAARGCWWADPAVGVVIIYYADREAHATLIRPSEAQA